jgi:hypothetical protein
VVNQSAPTGCRRATRQLQNRRINPRSSPSDLVLSRPKWDLRVVLATIFTPSGTPTQSTTEALCCHRTGCCTMRLISTLCDHPSSQSHNPKNRSPSRPTGLHSTEITGWSVGVSSLKEIAVRVISLLRSPIGTLYCGGVKGKDGRMCFARLCRG